MSIYRMLINGELVASESVFEVLNPATGLRFASAPNATSAHVAAALQSARAAFKPWSLRPQSERSSMLLVAAAALEARRADLEVLLVKEQGKPLASAVAETSSAIASFRGAAEVVIPVKAVQETATHILQVHHKPLGVVVGITPWNFPLSLGCGKIARSIAHGNTVILKPSPFTPLTSLLVGELLKDVFPPGVVNVITGSDGGETKSVGEQLVNSPLVNLVSFTGSGPTGKKIMAACATNMTRVMLELGGNDPAIVLPDADVEHAVKGIYQMAMANSGQICCAIKRVYVHDSIYEEFVKRASEMALAAVVGDGMVEGTQYGPLNNKAQLARVEMLVKDAQENGAKIVSTPLSKEGLFYPPTIVTNVAEGVRLVDEEQFGPVMPVMNYTAVAEAVARANNSEYGLGASVWGRDPVLLNQVAEELEAGIVWTNQHAVLREGAPFGGIKQSGFRREGDGAEADLDTYTEVKTIKLSK